MLQVKDLSVAFETKRGRVQALRSVNFSIAEGQALGLVGESGSGKSVTSLAIMGLLPNNAQITSGQISFSGEKKVAMIFQNPMTSLNPAFTIRDQLVDVLKIHQKTPESRLREKCLEALHSVGIPEPESRLGAYPHQLSGGMAQRVMIALAMACEPRLLIADEPTTALDVTIQAQILSLIRRIQKERGLSLLLISHDLGVIAQNTSQVCVMYAGEIVEQGETSQVIQKSMHPYTDALLSCLPSRHFAESNKTRLPSIPGLVPDLLHRPSGCQFQPRCSKAVASCESPIPLLEKATNRFSRCTQVNR